MSPAPPLWRARLGPARDPIWLAGLDAPDATAWAAARGPQAVQRWLGPDEAHAWSALRMPDHRSHRLAGRLAATAALRACCAEPWPRVRPQTQGPHRGKPCPVRSNGTPIDATLSITHAGGHALAAARRSPVGVDLDLVEPRSPDFPHLAFTPTERTQLPHTAERWGLTPLQALTLQWCAKEAFLKLLGVGLRAALQDVYVPLPDRPRPAPLDAHRGRALWPAATFPQCGPTVGTWGTTTTALTLCGACRDGLAWAVVWT